MIIPEEFKQLAQSFYQDSADEISTAEEWVSLALAHLDVHQKSIVKLFLDRILNANYEGAELQRIWNSTSPNYDFSDQDLRGFLILIRDMIETNLR